MLSGFVSPVPLLQLFPYLNMAPEYCLLAAAASACSRLDPRHGQEVPQPLTSSSSSQQNHLLGPLCAN